MLMFGVKDSSLCWGVVERNACSRSTPETGGDHYGSANFHSRAIANAPNPLSSQIRQARQKLFLAEDQKVPNTRNALRQRQAPSLTGKDELRQSGSTKKLGDKKKRTKSKPQNSRCASASQQQGSLR